MSKAFNLMTELDDSVLMIVDSLNLSFRYMHKKQFNFIEDYKRTVESLRKSYKAKYVVIAADKGSSSYRKELLPEYKDNRKEKFIDQTEQEALEFELFFEEFNKLIDSFIEDNNYPVFRFEKTEADDIAAYIVKFKEKFGITKIVLISTDRDWDLLISEDVIRFSYTTRKETRLDNWEEHYPDCSPEDYISIKCLQGDTGDNIPGVPGIGPKKATALVKQYGTTYDIAANLPINSKYKHIQNLNDFGMQALLRNYQLMDLLEFCEDALGENTKVIDKVLTEYIS